MSSVIDDGRHGPYKAKYTCFDCRKTFKGIDRNARYKSPRKCPDCEGNLICMPENFKSPKKSNKRAWAKLRNLTRRRYNIFTRKEYYREQRAARLAKRWKELGTYR